MSQKHRGQHPSDFKLFTAKTTISLQKAVADYSWLLTRGYPEKGALKLVGDHFRMKERQRKAVQRCSCSEEALNVRTAKHIPKENLAGQSLWIDGFNILITLESALSKGLIFEGRDGCFRDLASIHGTYKKVSETERAIHLVGDFLAKQQVKEVFWLFDKPVSNSGRMKAMIYEIAETKGWNWNAELFFNPDNELMACDAVVVTTDSMILDYAKRWTNLSRFLVEESIPDAVLIRSV